MATTTIPWGDGSGDNIYLEYSASQGDQTVLVSSDANSGPARTKDITFISTVGNISRVLTVLQESGMDLVSITWNDVCITYDDTAIAYPYVEQYIVFADPVVEQICATNWGDGVGLKPSQAAAVTATGTVFNGQSITSFDELGTYFTGLTTVTSGAFQNCTSLESIVFPSSVTTFSSQCLAACTALKSLTINSNVANLMLANANVHVGDGTGTMLINGDFDQNYSGNGPYFDFKIVHITGNLTQSSGGSTYILRSNYTEQLIVDGNINRSYTVSASNTLKFIDLGGTYNNMVPGSSIPTTCIAHLRYNGVAGTPNNLRIARVSKVYVDNATVLAAYQADSAWSAYTAKLDLWENYNGEYKD